MQSSKKTRYMSDRFWLGAACVFLAGQLAFNFVFAVTGFDEVNFAYKGWMVVKGLYPLYQVGGPWFEYMPLSFYFPGVIQALCGPSLPIQRLLSVICTVLLFFFIYRTTERLAGRTAAVMSLWLLIGCLACVRHYSVGSSESWTALALILAIHSLVSVRSRMTGGLLGVFWATVALFFRQNMLIAWALVMAFVMLTQKKIRAAVLVLAFGAALLIGASSLFWPGIAGIYRSLPVIGKLAVLSNTTEPALNVQGTYYTFDSQRKWRGEGEDGTDAWVPEKKRAHPILNVSNARIRKAAEITDFLVTNHAFWKNLNRFVLFYLPILLSSFIGILLMLRDRRTFTAGESEDRLPMYLLLASVFLVNLAGHLGFSGMRMFENNVRYIAFYAPVGAILRGCVLAGLMKQGEWGRGFVMALLVVFTVTQVFSGSLQYRTQMPLTPGLNHVADRLKALTSPQDRIFSVADMHVFFLAERFPYPHLMNSLWGFKASEAPADVVQLSPYWSYELAKKDLQEADVVVLADEPFRFLNELYMGAPNSGRITHDLIQNAVDRDFHLVEDVCWYYEGCLHVYRRNTVAQNVEK